MIFPLHVCLSHFGSRHAQFFSQSIHIFLCNRGFHHFTAVSTGCAVYLIRNFTVQLMDDRVNFIRILPLQECPELVIRLHSIFSMLSDLLEIRFYGI